MEIFREILQEIDRSIECRHIFRKEKKNSMGILEESTHYGKKFSIFTSMPFGSCTPEQQQQSPIIFHHRKRHLPFFCANSNRVECRKDPSR